MPGAALHDVVRVDALTDIAELLHELDSETCGEQRAESRHREAAAHRAEEVDLARGHPDLAGVHRVLRRDHVDLEHRPHPDSHEHEVGGYGGESGARVEQREQDDPE